MDLSLPTILRVQSGRLVPQESGRTLLAVTIDEGGDCLRVQEFTHKGRIIGMTDFAAADPEISVTRAINSYLGTHNFWKRRK